ncbi:hypothetical protein GGR57DRAFT_502919 [Xylariaceae sp. FL1272]|nr:hypothetical protein GGR57DRAFT_502919 [Xylariaceae sp. FL1272]
MFGTFKADGKTILSEALDGIDSRTYTRTVKPTDLPSGGALRCSGDTDRCETCQSLSIPCTYTLSSGTRAGKKRVRRNADAEADADFTVGRFRTTWRPSSPADNGNGNSTSNSNNRSRRSSSSINKKSQGDDRRSKPSSPKRPSTATEALGTQSPALQKHGVSPVSPSTFATTSWLPNTSVPALAGVSSLFDSNDGGFDSGKGKQPGLEFGSDEMRCLPNTIIPPIGTAAAAQEATSLSSSTSSSPACRCLSDMAQLFEIAAGQILNSRQKWSIENLLIDLEDGIATCKKILVCNVCTASTDNSTLLASVAVQVVGAWETLVNAHLQCKEGFRSSTRTDSISDQTRGLHVSPLDSSEATTVVYGRYEVKSPRMKSLLLSSLLQLHHKSLTDLLGCLRIAVDQKQGASEIVDNAARKVEKINHLLTGDVSRDGSGAAQQNGTKDHVHSV